MRILILTQKVDINDDILGFMHNWILEFARNVAFVAVICLQRGEYSLPQNVKVLSLCKEGLRGATQFSSAELAPQLRGPNSPCTKIGRPAQGHLSSLWRKIKYIFRFYKIVWCERKKYDAVFVHMNPEYIVLAGWLWRIWGKKVGLWYAHGHAPLSLKIAEKFCDIIFTSTRSGCRLESSKIKIVGQGIDTQKLKIKNEKLKTGSQKFRIISIGRISPSKDYETLIKAMEILLSAGNNVSAEIIGGPAMEKDVFYFENLKRIVGEKKLTSVINFVGPVANKAAPAYLQNADLFVNMGLTGSLDKAVLEAMACGLPILTCNEAFGEILGGLESRLMFEKNNADDLAVKLKNILSLNTEERAAIGHQLRLIVEQNHSLPGLIAKIIKYLS